MYVRVTGVDMDRRFKPHTRNEIHDATDLTSNWRYLASICLRISQSVLVNGNDPAMTGV